MYSIKDIFHERAWLYSDIYGVDVRIVTCLGFFLWDCLDKMHC